MSAPGTEMQARFVLAYVQNGGNATAAAIEAGYSAKSADDLGPRTLQLPHVQEMILQELAKQRSRAGAVGLKVLVDVAQNDKAPAPARVAAGRALLEFAGVASGSNGADDAASRLGQPAPDYRAVLDALATISRHAVNGGARIQ